MNTGRLETVWAPRVLSILRIVAALLFFEHGTAKLLGFPASPHSPEFLSLSWIAGALELIGGPLLIVGLFTRPVAFILSGQMAFAYWLAHAPQSVFPLLNNGDAAILYCFIFLYLAFAGGGAWSVDAMLKKDARASGRPA
jgi:putative oxidoreductase